MYHCCGFGFRQSWCHKWKKGSKLKLIPVHHHFLINSCIRFKSGSGLGSGRIYRYKSRFDCKNEIRYTFSAGVLICTFRSKYDDCFNLNHKMLSAIVQTPKGTCLRDSACIEPLCVKIRLQITSVGEPVKKRDFVKIG